MKRRSLLQYGAASALAITSTGLFVKSSEAFFLGFLVRSLTSRFLFQAITSSISGSVFSRLDDRSSEESLAIQLAEKDFIEEQFTRNRTSYSEFGSNVYWGVERERDDEYIRDVGFGFVEASNSVTRTSRLGSPIMTGIYAASDILKDQGLSPSEIGRSIMPTRTQLQDLCGWEGGRNGTCFASYRTVLGEIFFRYDLQESGVNGHGDLSVIVDAAGFPRREIDIQVDFA